MNTNPPKVGFEICEKVTDCDCKILNLYLCLYFFFIDNELHDHFLKDNKREIVNQGEQCGSGILVYRALGKLQSKVNNLSQTWHRQNIECKHKVKNKFC